MERLFHGRKNVNAYSKSGQRLTTMINFLLLATFLLLAATALPQKALAGHPNESEMAHPPQEIPTGLVAPQLALELLADEMAGFNLTIHTKNYRLIPPNLAYKETLTQLEGHAHLYINGVKIQRIYGPYIHLPRKLFRPGINQITVSLNGHNHRPWQLANGLGATATLLINTLEAKLIKSHYSSSEIQ